VNDSAYSVSFTPNPPDLYISVNDVLIRFNAFDKPSYRFTISPLDPAVVDSPRGDYFNHNRCA
jgi:hypothetical protein